MKLSKPAPLILSSNDDFGSSSLTLVATPATPASLGKPDSALTRQSILLTTSHPHRRFRVLPNTPSLSSQPSSPGIPPPPYSPAVNASSATLDYLDYLEKSDDSSFTGSTHNLIDHDDHHHGRRQYRKRGLLSWISGRWSAFQSMVGSHVSFSAILEVIDIREYFWPFTWRKYAVLSVVAACVALIVVTNHYFHWIDMAMKQTRQSMLPVLVLVLGLEPLMVIVLLFVAQVPDLPRAAASRPCNTFIDSDSESLDGTLQVYDSFQSQSRQPWLPTSAITHRTALVVPCHKSDREALKRVLESAYPHFRPQDIFIVDNGRSMTPLDPDMREWVFAQHPDIVYIWSPIGSKNAAQLVGAMAAKDCEYIMTVDDDVLIPSNFVPPEEMINDKVKGVAFPIRAHDADGNTPLFMVGWQDCEYRLSGLSKMAESRLCGVLFPHGAGWFAERDTFIDMLSHYHPMDFFGDDTHCGLCFMKMGKQIALDSRVVLGTEVPSTIIGPGLNWWKQRFKSWEMARHGLNVKFAERLFLSLNGQRTLHGILWQKFLFLYAILSNVVDWIRVPVFVTMGANTMFWTQAMLLTLFAAVPLLAYNYVKCRRRPDLRSPFFAAITYPVYKQLYALVSIFGAIRCVLYYVGGHQMPKTIGQMLKDGDERCFWLDPRFETNPGFLAEGQDDLDNKDSTEGR